MRSKLKELRESKGMTQEQLATAIGSNKSYISGLENGTRNIKTIRSDTMQRLCAVLECEAKDLIISADFEHDENDRLIVDKIYCDPVITNKLVVEIDGEYFTIPSLSAFKKGIPVERQLAPMMRPVSKTAEEVQQYIYVMYRCVPREGFKVVIGRAITTTEFQELKYRFKLTEDDISDTFVDTKGGIYKGYAKSFEAVQIRVPGSEAVSLERILRDKGIEAANGSPGRVNIRIK